MKKVIVLLSLIPAFFVSWASNSQFKDGNPGREISFDQLSEAKGIGLTLSGGGARGIAHIGVLHLLDSLEIRVDYVTGTSMGAIIGGMYAAGYSASEIEAMVLEIDWDALFSADVGLEFVHPSRRRDVGKHIVNMPWEDGRFRFETGAVEAQNLWEELSRTFFHVSHIENFEELPIPFACIATDLSTGESIILREGELIRSIRASMAVPAVFTAVEINDMKLIDGGVTKNFPVSVARDLGAESVLGVNVSRGLRPVSDLRSPIDVIYQMGFFSDARSFQENKRSASWFMDLDLGDISPSDFASAPEIIDAGKRAAAQYIEVFKEIKENQKKAGIEFTSRVSGAGKNFVVRSIEVRGRKNLSRGFMDQIIPIKPGDNINRDLLQFHIRSIYATDVFERVKMYALDIDGEEVDLVIEVKETPFVRVAANINYNEIQGVGVGGGLQMDNFLLNNSHLRLKTLIGENPFFKGEYHKFIDYQRNRWISLGLNASLIRFSYSGLGPFLSYRRSIIDFNLRFNELTGPHSYWSAGIGRSTQKLAQRNEAPVRVRGWSGGWYTFGAWNKYTLDRHAFPTTGQDFQIYVGANFGQNENLDVSIQELESNKLEDLGLSFGNYVEIKAKLNYYIPLSEEVTQIFRIHAAHKFGYEQGFLHAYNIGGVNEVITHQMEFIGLKEFAIISPSIFSAQVGWQRKLSRRFLTSLAFQAGYYDFDPGRISSFSTDNFLFGGGASLGYLSMVGPIQITFGYSPYTNRIVGYFNLGWSF